VFSWDIEEKQVSFFIKKISLMMGSSVLAAFLTPFLRWGAHGFEVVVP
jgi:hypothetical protein